MKTMSSIIATGHLDKHNCIMAEEALQDLASHLNRPRKVRIGLQHDPLVPPIGWVAGATLEPHEGTYAVVGTNALFDRERNVTLPNGEPAQEHFAEGAEFRFHCPDDDQAEEVVVSTDPVGFESFEQHDEFCESLAFPDGLTCSATSTMHKSLIHDPEIVVTIAAKVGLVFLVVGAGKAYLASLGSELGKYTGVKVTGLISLMGDAFIKFAASMSHKNRPTTYIVRILSDPVIELVARTTDVHRICEAYCDPQFGDLYEDVVKLNGAFGVDSVQFRLEDDGTWKFNYLLTKTGTVIGTKAAYDHRAKVLSEMDAEVKLDARPAVPT